MLQIRAGKLALVGAVIAAYLAGSQPLRAQQDAGAIVVVVSDPGNAAVIDAAITIVDKGKTSTIRGVTNDIGAWTAAALSPGQYSVTVERANFKKAVVERVTVELQKVTRVPVSLSLGNVSEQVTVTAENALLQTENSSKAELIADAINDDLPVLDRNFNRLTTVQDRTDL